MSQPHSVLFSPSLLAMAASSTTTSWGVGGPRAKLQRHYVVFNFCGSKQFIKRSLRIDHLGDNFDELFRNVENEDSIVIRCYMCCRTSHQPISCVGCGMPWRGVKGKQRTRLAHAVANSALGLNLRVPGYK